MSIGAFFQRHAIACELLPYSGTEKLVEEIYIASDTDTGLADGLSELVALAKVRIGNVYGAPEATPRIILASTPEAAKSWGANTTATMHRSPWRTCIVIGPNGKNVDVISHEWLHSEIQTRVGFWRFLKDVPVWFDEGAALTVDRRAPFLLKNIELSSDDVSEVRMLGTGREFFSGDVHKHYQASRLAVEPLIEAKTFFNDLDRIGNGESFKKVFLKENKS